MKNRIIEIRNELTEMKSKLNIQISENMKDKKKLKLLSFAVNYIQGAERSIDEVVWYLNRLEEIQ